MPQEEEDFYLDLSPKQRKELQELGLEPKHSGVSVDRSGMMNKSLAQVQGERVAFLMNRIETPLEEERREYSEFRFKK